MAKQEKSSKGKMSKTSASYAKPIKGASVPGKPAVAHAKGPRKK